MVYLFISNGQHYDWGPRKTRLDLACRLDAVHSRKFKIQYDEARCFFLHDGDSLLSADGLNYVYLRIDHMKPFAERYSYTIMIVNDQDSFRQDLLLSDGANIVPLPFHSNIMA